MIRGMVNRAQQIEQILADLIHLEKITSDNKLYAVKENMAFFCAARSFFSLINWLLTRMPKLNPEKLLEINDILPKWDNEMHLRLIQVERQKFPGLIEPLVEEIIKFVKANDKPLVLANIGSGGMEVERQVIERLLKDNHRQPTIFLGIDQSSAAHHLAKENLRVFVGRVKFEKNDHLDNHYFDGVLKSGSRFIVVHSQSNILCLDTFLTTKVFDLVYHSLFQHHLSSNQRAKLDHVLSRVASKRLEYDGVRSNALFIPLIITAWASPVFLNASVFSNLRFDKRKDIKLKAKQSEVELSFYPLKGTYLLKYL